MTASANSGQSWFATSFGTISDSGYVNNIMFRDAQTGFGFGRYGHILRTLNAFRFRGRIQRGCIC